MSESYSSGASRAIEQKRIEAGQIGKLLGMGDPALKNVMGMSAIILLLIIVGVITFFENKSEAIETIKIISPIFALVIGYLAGAIKK